MSVFFVGPRFHKFESHIVSAIKKAGFVVKFSNEKIDLQNSVLYRLMHKIPCKIRGYFFDSYVDTIINNSNESDLVLFIRGEFWKERHIDALKKKHPKALFVMYQWDFSENLPHLEEQLPFFDRIFTFDKNDAQHYGFELKPLFFTDAHAKAKNNQSEYPLRYKVAFVGTHHSDRFEFVRKFAVVNGLGSDEFFYHLLRPKLSYLFSKYIARQNIGTIRYSDLQSTALSETETIAIMMSSECILDIHHEKQSGLTIRSLEALGLGKKLITTNPYVREYDFFNPDNICVIDRDNPLVPDSFLSRPYTPVPDSVYRKYNVHQWVREFLNK
jgi:hypothetical protein